MEPATIISIIAVSVTILGLIGNITITAMSYKKSRRHEFRQRRDHLSQCILDLDKLNNEARGILTRYDIVALKQSMLPMLDEHVEKNKALIASIKVQREGAERELKQWDLIIERLQPLYSRFNSESDESHIESLITLVKEVEHQFNKFCNGYSATLNMLETANELTKNQLAATELKIKQINSETAADIRQINLDAEAQKRQINFDTDAAVRKSNLKYEAEKRQINLDYESTLEKLSKQKDDS